MPHDGAEEMHQRPILAYVAATFPVYSETFVYREVRELRRRGWVLHPVSLHAPVSPGSHDFDDITVGMMVLYAHRGQLFIDMLREGLRHPLRSIRTMAVALGDILASREAMPLVSKARVVMQACAALGLARHLRARSIQHIHCHFAHSPTTVGMYCALQLGVTFSFTGHANDIFQRRSLLGTKLRRAAFVSCISKWHRRFYQSIYPDGTDRYSIIRCGVNTGKWRPSQIGTPSAEGQKDELHVLAVCRLVPKKGVDILIRALCDMRNRHHRQWKLTVVGEGPELPLLRELAETLDCSKQIEWRGALANESVRQLMHEADMLALTCRVDANGDRDGIPVVLMEAMACGVPVIVGDLPSIRELVEDGTTGLCVDVSSPAHVADRLAWLAANHVQRQRMATAGRKHVEDEFSLDANVDRLEASFNLVLNGATGTSQAIRVAYLNTQYPSLSHTFIEREVRAIRSHGIQVQPFSIRRPAANDLLSDRHRQAAAETCYVRTHPLVLSMAVMRAAITRPWSLSRVMVASQKLSTPGLEARFRHMAYAAEAVLLAREMNARQLRHIHVHMANNGAAVAWLACRFDSRITYSLSIHGSAEFFQVVIWRLKEKAEGAVFVRCISNFCMSQVMAWSDPKAWNRYSIVHCGVEPTLFAPRPPLPTGPLRILTVGRWDPIKGYPLLLEACRVLSQRGIDWTLDMVGDGPLRSLLEDQVRTLQLTDRVTLSGPVGHDRIQEHFDRADVMVISSFMEGVPVVLMEAMAKQIAVVASRVGGIPELIDEGINGLLVTPGSIESLANALARLALDREELSVFGPAARQKIVNEFSADNLGRQMANLFRHYGVGGHLLSQDVKSARVPVLSPVP